MAQRFDESHTQNALKFDHEADLTDLVSEGEITAAGVTSPVRKTGRKGFLPMRTNTWDRVFVSIYCFVAIHLLWMRFIEPYLPANNIWIAFILSIVLAMFIIRRG